MYGLHTYFRGNYLNSDYSKRYEPISQNFSLIFFGKRYQRSVGKFLLWPAAFGPHFQVVESQDWQHWEYVTDNNCEEMSTCQLVPIENKKKQHNIEIVEIPELP